MLNRYLIIINSKTLIALGISILVLFFAEKYSIDYEIDLTLISIAIIFPLVFCIRSAFRRREKALEHLSQFRSNLRTIEHYVKMSKLSEEKLKDFSNLIIKLETVFLDELSKSKIDLKKIDKNTQGVFDFLKNNDEEISGGIRQKAIRFLRDVSDGQDNLIAIYLHRTPISLKAYCLIFIYLFPLVYTPTIIHKMGNDSDAMILTSFVVLLSEFILISLYNIQDQMEYPFDDDGLDDIQLKKFKSDRF
jgi:predicted membrane chloride channel (bestrophin family)|tara:strand:- start:239 stop:982 length:744 start_codon:yes stop_codon:yes gene_type:complete